MKANATQNASETGWMLVRVTAVSCFVLACSLLVSTLKAPATNAEAHRALALAGITSIQ